MKLGYTIIYVENVENTLAFYEKAFGIERTFVAESGLYAEVKSATGTKLGFCSAAFVESSGIEFAKNDKTSKAAGFQISFIADDVEKAYNKACSAGAIAIKAPETKHWGQVVAVVRDNNGILVEICTAMGDY